jgi:hypothetical protein
MANKRISSLDDITLVGGTSTAGLSTTDIIPVTDVDDTTGSPQGTTKKVTVANLLSGLQAEPAEGAFVDGDKTKLDGIDISAFGATLVDDADASAARTTLGLGTAATSASTDFFPSSYSTQTYTASGTPLAFTLTSAAKNKVVTVNETSNVYVTVPTGLGAGFNCKFVQLGAGKIVLQAGSGALLNSYTPGSEIQNTTLGQYAEIELVPVTTDSYVIVGNSTTGPFLNNYSVSLDGTNDYVDYGVLGALNSVSAFTISTWIKTSTANRMVFSGGTSNRMSLLAAGAQVILGGTTANIGSTDYDDGNWHQITLVYNSGTVTIYSDGSSTANGSSSIFASSTQSSAFNTFRIGQVANLYYFNGVIDEFAVWSSALSSSEIPDIQASSAPIDLRSDNGNYTSSSNLINYWRMGDNDGGSGTTVTDLVGTLDGTLTNGASFTADTP